MKDARLVEVEFLSGLERNGLATYDGLYNPEDGPFGVPRRAFREMLFQLFADGCLSGDREFLREPTDRYQSVETQQAAHMIADQQMSMLVRGLTVQVRITHAGRLRLWRLRDELLSGQRREAFGLLWDRAAWDRALPVQMQFAANDAPLSIMLIDVDEFKQVNDQKGHAVGDEVLRSVFSIVVELSADRGYRYGGDEIAILLPDTPEIDANKLAEGLRARVERDVGQATALERPQTVSVGVLTCSAPCEVGAAFEAADKLLYAAKKEGRNRVKSATSPVA